jgi:hypothetical protein
MSHGDANRERLVAMVVVDPFDLDALAVSDRFRLFGFTRRDDYLAYLWVLRAIDRLRGAHVAQAHTDISARAQRHAAPSTERIRRQASPRRRSESRQRTALVAVRLLPHERDMLSETARARGVSLSEFIRSSAMSIASGLAASRECP